MEIGIIERNPQPPPPRPAAQRAPAPAAGTSEADVDARLAAERLEEIRQHHLDMYARREVVARTTTSEGDQVDWVPVEQQGTGAVAEPPPLEDRDLGDPERPTRAAPLPFASNAEKGPPGTVPLLRKPVEELRPVGTLAGLPVQGALPASSSPRRTTPIRRRPAPRTSTRTPTSRSPASAPRGPSTPGSRTSSGPTSSRWASSGWWAAAGPPCRRSRSALRPTATSTGTGRPTSSSSTRPTTTRRRATTSAATTPTSRGGCRSAPRRSPACAWPRASRVATSTTC